MKVLHSNKAIALMLTLIITLVATIYLSSYVIWTVWDQRNLLRQQKVEEAAELAWSGINHATLDLSLDTNSWLNGEINGYNVTGCSTPPCVPNPSNPDAFYSLYNGSLENGTYGNYSVELRYLYNNATARFYDKRIWVRSTGITPNASRVLGQIVDLLRVKNDEQDATYASLQTAVNKANTNEYLLIAPVTLSENVTITCGKNFNIRGCYDCSFSNASCGNYYSNIIGSVTITGTGTDSANVTLSGVTIE